MGLGEHGKGAFISREQGNKQTKILLGNMEHRKTNFRFLGNRGTIKFISAPSVTYIIGHCHPSPTM